MNATHDSTEASRARADFKSAVDRNEAAIAEGANPPFGQGALLVLRRRWEAAEAAE